MKSQLKIVAQLMRLDRPIGFTLLAWPSLWSLWVCTQGKPALDLSLWLLAGVIVARSAGCVINDIVDYDVDGLVARTKDRPLAKGLWSRKQALGLFVILMLIAAIIAWHLQVWHSALIAAGLMSLYPFFKRFFFVPQLWLGLNWGWSVFVVWDACKVAINASVIWLFFVALFWTLAFDTLYAITDRAFDRKLKLHSMAIWLGSRDLLGIGFCYLMMLIFWYKLVHTLPNPVIGITGIPVILLFIAAILNYCKRRDPKRCFAAFKANNWLGAYFWLLLVLSFWQHPF